MRLIDADALLAEAVTIDYWWRTRKMLTNDRGCDRKKKSWKPDDAKEEEVK